MTNKKINALTAATTPLAGTEVLPIVQSSATTQVSVANLTAGRAVATQSVSTTSASNFSGGVNASAAVIIDKTGSTIGRMRLFVGDGTGSTVADDNYIGNLNTDLHIRAGAAGLVETFVFSLDGNLFPKVAAKGINFTANTGLGGKTSQLLNWYEEGTWTVVWTSLTGTATNTTGYYTRIGRLVTFSYAVQNAAVAVGSFPSTHFTLPIAPAKDSAGQIASQGNSFSGSIDIEAGAAYPSNFSANYLVFSGSYIV